MSAKIIPFGGVTRLELPVDQVLDAAKEECAGAVIVMGWDHDDRLYFASSMSDGAEILWCIEMLKKALLEIGE